VLAITGAEEKPKASTAPRALLELNIERRGERWTFCLVGEPDVPNSMGEMIKIGRGGP